MSYTEHDGVMDSHDSNGITVSDAVGSSPMGVFREAPGVKRANSAGDRTEDVAPVLKAGTEGEATIPVAQTGGGGLDPPGALSSSGESEQADEAGPETPVEEKPKRRWVSRKKAVDSPGDISGGETTGEVAQTSEKEDTSSDASGDLNARGGDAPEYDDNEDLETDAPVLSDGGEGMLPIPLKGTGNDDTVGAPMEDPEPAPSPKAQPTRCVALTAKTASKPKKEFISRPLKDKPTLLSLDLSKLDEDLSEEKWNGWNVIYASYRPKSISTGRIMGIDTHSFTIRNRKIRQTERRKMLYAVIINCRVKVSISEAEMWYPDQEQLPYVFHNMSGVETGCIILGADHEGSVVIGSRRMALAVQRHFLDTIKGGRSIGERLTYRVLAAGPRRCLVEYGGRDMSLSRKDLTYIATPNLRTRYHPGQASNYVLEECDRREGRFQVPVKDTMDNPFFGTLRGHPIGSRRQVVTFGKYGGGVFYMLSDETVYLCHYSTLHSDLDFYMGDTIILATRQSDYERSLIYGRILSK